ncbi:MAG: hypothetical protein ABI682_08775 [Acidobacteriota bacterium]
MRRVWALLAAGVLVSRSEGTATLRPKPPARPLLGLAAELPPSAGEADRQRAAKQIRATGASLFVIPISWSACEPSARTYKVQEILRTVRLLRQSGAAVHIDLPLVSVRTRDVPADLATLAFDDPRLSTRLGLFLEALEPALLDASTLSLGYAAENYFEQRPDELKPYRLLFDGAVVFLKKMTPHLKVGVTTAAPTESAAPAVAAALHQRSPVLFYLYAPFERQNPYMHRRPDSIERDWKMLLERAAGRPIAFPEVSYSSSPENGSTPELQAEFVRRLKKLTASADGSTLLFARYSTLRDVPSASPAPPGNALAARRQAFVAHRGLQTEKGEPKPAWREWVRAAP